MKQQCARRVRYIWGGGGLCNGNQQQRECRGFVVSEPPKRQFRLYCSSFPNLNHLSVLQEVLTDDDDTNAVLSR